MKILYLTSVSMTEHSGVSKKIKAQCEALEYLKNEIDLCYINRNNEFCISRELYKNGEYNILKKFKLSSKVLKKIYALRLIYNYKDVINYIKNNNYEIIYIRYIYSSNIGFINFLKKIKKINKNIKIIVEIPTYPYDVELLKSSFLDKIRFLQENYYRKKLKKYVDRIVTFSNDNEIFGIKTIKINNGIDINQISIIKRLKKQKNKEISFISVAQIAFWHGIDRFILAMGEYYKNNPKDIIKFHIVGNGNKEIMEELKKLVKENNLDDYIIFYGYKSGKDLDEIYNKSDIGIGSLGNFRKGILNGGALKNQEYCAKGLPFIIAGYDDNYKDVDFMYKVTADESLINLNEIINWYKNLQVTSEQIRKYVEDNLTWDIQMKKVVDYILETEEK